MDAVTPLSGISQATPLRGPAPSVAQPAERSTFGNILRDQLLEVNEEHRTADHAIQELATGNSDNVHETVMSVVQADLSLRMIVEIRNRLIESYQEIMRMQI